mmetsp:Transcript_25873/g.56985  ORF Transcript_25873/g.56985 Transcript_25873/m.56985 type:complete len:92 (+) Transcript_25873:137-412(+)
MLPRLCGPPPPGPPEEEKDRHWLVLVPTFAINKSWFDPLLRSAANESSLFRIAGMVVLACLFLNVDGFFTERDAPREALVVRRIERFILFL